MTVPAGRVTEITGVGDDSTTSFSFSPMVIHAASDLEVTHVDAAGAETTITQGTGATNWSTAIVTFPNTGSITYPADEVTPLPTGEFLNIRNAPPIRQSADLRRVGAYDPIAIEDQLDLIVNMLLELDERVDRCIKLRRSETTLTDTETDVPAASETLKVTAAGTGVEWA